MLRLSLAEQLDERCPTSMIEEDEACMLGRLSRDRS